MVENWFLGEKYVKEYLSNYCALIHRENVMY